MFLTEKCIFWWFLVFQHSKKDVFRWEYDGYTTRMAMYDNRYNIKIDGMFVFLNILHAN